MPNGYDRNWLRLAYVLEGFFAAHGHWPSRVRVQPLSLENLRNDLFTAASWEQITARIQFIPDESVGMVAEDVQGNAFNFGQRIDRKEAPSVEDWLGVQPDVPHEYDDR
jgi:hypothetical protein